MRKLNEDSHFVNHVECLYDLLISWMIAFIEYCFQVPANRIGYRQFLGAELKTIQEIITLTVFFVFSVFYLKEGLKWNYRRW
jgi:uncharacterized protein (DUF486 family)